MELTEHIAQFLRDNDFTGATNGIMPMEPDRIVTVYATGLLKPRDPDGSRFQVIVRSERDNDTALGDALRIIDLLDEFEGLLTIDSPYILRMAAESGAANLGADGNGRLSYSINFRAWYC